MKKWWMGEFLGTFLLIFFGCGSLASAVTTDVFAGIGQIASIWGLGIALAIYMTASLSGAHLNPAVTLGLWIAQRFKGELILPYFMMQFAGAFAASFILYLIFSESIIAFELMQGIVRGASGSEKSAMIFTEFFPNPSVVNLGGRISLGTAMIAEIIGTAVLMLSILCLTDDRNQERPLELKALMIGLTVALLVCLLGPITMACFNPARDLAPRIFTFFAGWGAHSFTYNESGWLMVYVLSPCLGAAASALVYRLSAVYVENDVKKGSAKQNGRGASLNIEENS